MPIRPENMAKYPGGSIKSPEWLAIRERIRQRAGDCCEECGIVNHAVGVRLLSGEFIAVRIAKLGSRISHYIDGVWVSGKVIQIVCTVAHFDGKLDDHSDENLRFWCQRCHNRHDARSRQENATITRHEKAGQLDLIGRK